MKDGKQLGISPWPWGSQGVMEADLLIQHVLCSSVGFPGLFFNVERVAESLESFAEKYNLCESQQGALRVQNARGKRMVLQLTWEICFAKFLCCFKLIRLICDTVFLSSPHQALCVVSCLRNKGTCITGFWDGSSNLVLMLMLCSLFIQALCYLLSPFVADC